MRSKYLFHFAMNKECPRDLINPDPTEYYGLREFDNDLEGMYDTIYDNIKVWISGASSNRVLEPPINCEHYLAECDYVFNFGLCGAVSGDLAVGDIVEVDKAFNMDLKMPNYGTGCSDSYDADVLDLSFFNSDSFKKVICGTSNKFVTRDYYDYVVDSDSIGLEVSSHIEDPSDVAKISGVVCDMELFYLIKLVNICNGFRDVCSFKMISDVVVKDDNYSEYEGSIETLIDKLHDHVMTMATNIINLENDIAIGSDGE